MGLITRKPVFGVSDKATFKPEILLVASLDMILSNKGITQVLIRLHICTGWSTPLLLAAPEDRFSRVKAQYRQCPHQKTSPLLHLVLTLLGSKCSTMKLLMLIFVKRALNYSSENGCL